MTEPEPHQRRTGRDFPENGIKRLLQHAANVRDLLKLGAPEIVERIDFDGMRPAPGTSVDPKIVVRGRSRWGANTPVDCTMTCEFQH